MTLKKNGVDKKDREYLSGTLFFLVTNLSRWQSARVKWS
jgi:hypothetical protein